MGPLLFILAIAVGILALLYWGRKWADEGEIIGYNKELGVPTLYDFAKDEKSIEEGRKTFHPTRMAPYLTIGLLLLALGVTGFFISSGTSLLGPLFLTFMGLLFLAGAVWVHYGAKPIKNKVLGLIIAWALVFVVLAVIVFGMFPDIVRGREWATTVFFAVFFVGTSLYSYLRQRGSPPPAA